MIDPVDALTVARQADLAGLSRASIYYLPRATSDADQRLMRRIDVLHLEYPFAIERCVICWPAKVSRSRGLASSAV